MGLRGRVLLGLVVASCARTPDQATPDLEGLLESAAAAPSRGAADLRRDVIAMQARVIVGALPEPGAATFIWPPSESEAALVRERSTPLAERLPPALATYDASVTVMHAYARARRQGNAVSETAGEVLWTESVIRQLGNLVVVLVEDMEPTVSPEDMERLGALDRMRTKAVAVLTRPLATFEAQRAQRQHQHRLARAMRSHAANYARLLGSAQCAAIRRSIATVLATEVEPVVMSELSVVDDALTRCTGRSPPSPQP